MGVFVLRNEFLPQGFPSSDFLYTKIASGDGGYG